MTNFLKSNPKLDAAITNCTDPESIRELAKSHLASTGAIARERGGDYGIRVLRGYQPAEPTPAVSLAENPDAAKYVRIIYPHENDRFEIYGQSEEDLDAQEARIRASY